MSYQTFVDRADKLIQANEMWTGIAPEAVARMRLQNRFRTGLEIARYTAAILRKALAAYGQDPSKYTQSLGCWHGFIGQQKVISLKKHFGSTERRYLYPLGLDDCSPSLGNSGRFQIDRCTRKPAFRL